MAELELARLHEDGEHLVLRAADGTEHALPITEALRAAVRRDRPRAEALRAQATLRPRDLQARLRAGATVEELAEESGLPAEHVQRYEWPVATERQHAIDQVRAHRLDGDGEVRTLGEAADARLGARGVTPDDARWSARREGSAPWVVEVRFAAGDRDRSARWTYDPKGRAVTPLDDEARWLGQPDDPLTPEVLGVPSTSDRQVPGRRSPERPPERPGDDTTALLLDDLAGRRGRRPAGRERPAEPSPAPSGGAVPGMLPLGVVAGPDSPGDGAERTAGGHERDDERHGGARDDHGRSPDHDTGNHDTGDRAAQDGPAPAGTAPAGPAPAHASVVDLRARRAGARAPVPSARAAHPSGTQRPEGGADAAARRSDVADREEPAPSAGPGQQPGPQPSAPAKAPARRTGRKGRPQVPSWDEIVFGGGRPSS
ncbi:septation protein SepH [Isoptericola sp. BMS4]|uniref:septation protein SepH n=1 Tax=Isoptericola sp. BMS4 TaxID=2527875 RepID=UPI001423E1B0|nr:septation protein SepH [Isoptericola sp. BMS4]